jgi:hypothetical protein
MCILGTPCIKYNDNIDYKLMTKCLAFRLKKVLPNIIHSDQTGCMRGRYIGDNIRNILEIIETVEEEDLSCVILLVDFEKAFDSLSWKFLQQCLDYFKLGSSFKKMDQYIVSKYIKLCS